MAGVFYDENNLNSELGTKLSSERDVNWDDFLKQMESSTSEVLKAITKKELKVHPTREAFQLFNVLTPEECTHLISQTEGLGYQKLSGYSGQYRSNTRRIIHYEDLKEILWARVSPFLTSTLPDKYLDNTWKAYGLNPQFRFCKYEPGQHFSPHYDANFAYSSTDKSFYTFMIYLNQVDDGGATLFLSDSADPPRGRVLERLAPEPGMLLVFQHNIFHEGETLNSGLKYMMRSDVMYRLEKNPEATPEQLNKSEKRLQAMEMINEAEQLEYKGKFEDAIAFYRKAYKLCPELETISKNDETKDSLVLDTQN